MRGNRLVRGGDPMKTRSQKRKEKKVKLAKTGRVIRLRKRLKRIGKRKCAEQQDTHVTAIMEAYILKRKAERKLEKEKLKQEEDASGASTNDGSSPRGCSETVTTRGNTIEKAGSSKATRAKKINNSNSKRATTRSLY